LKSNKFIENQKFQAWQKKFQASKIQLENRVRRIRKEDVGISY
jgi:hypothetical protein